jgi:hypothetical protein
MWVNGRGQGKWGGHGARTKVSLRFDHRVEITQIPDLYMRTSISAFF